MECDLTFDRKLAASAKMEDQIIFRKNCIGINYNVGEIKEYHYEKIIENLLGVPEDEVEGIDDRGSARFLFQVSTKKRYDLICESFTGRDITLETRCIIQVDDISSYGTRVETHCISQVDDVSSYGQGLKHIV